MDLYEAIFVRKSVKSYLNEPLPDTVLNQIARHYEEIPELFDHSGAAVSILDNTGNRFKRLSMFSVHAPYYLAFYLDEGPRYMMNAGYLLQQMSLYLTTIGLGSCVIGSTKIPKEYQEKGGKKLTALLAFGKSKGSFTRRHTEAKRLPLDELCVFKEVPREWVRQLLEAARMAPSASNSQPWRFVVFDNKIHIFSKKHQTARLSRYEELNFGILFANLTVTAEELWIDMDLIRLENLSQKDFPNNRYILSAILRY